MIRLNVDNGLTPKEARNSLFAQVNKIVDEYFDESGTTPERLNWWINENIDKFIDVVSEFYANKDEIRGIVRDVVSHRYNAYRDSISHIKKFDELNESFFFNLELNKPNINYEKVLADQFSTSLGHISVVDEKMHLYEINDFGKLFKAIVLSEDDWKKIRVNMVDSVVKQLKSSNLSVTGIDGFVLDEPVIISVRSVVDDSNLHSEVSSRFLGGKIQTVFLGLLRKLYPREEFNFIGSSNGFFVWQSK
jgi:hypothetical protein